MKDLLELQKAEFVKNGIPRYNDRVDVLKRCIALIETHDEQIIEALNQDFQNRSRTEIITSEISQTIRNLSESLHHGIFRLAWFFTLQRQYLLQVTESLQNRQSLLQILQI